MEESSQLQVKVQRRFRRLFLFITCTLVLTVIFMAVPRASNHGSAYFAKQTYYNHGADRGPHLGQKPHLYDSNSHTKSRKLKVEADSSYVDHTTPKFPTNFDQNVVKSL